MGTKTSSITLILINWGILLLGWLPFEGKEKEGGGGGDCFRGKIWIRNLIVFIKECY